MIKEILASKTGRSGNRVLCVCDNCSKEFISKYSEQTRRGKNQHFCSLDCYKKGYVSTDNQRDMARINLIKYNKTHNGNNMWAWKGGRYIGSNGYIFFYSPDHPNRNTQKYVLEHRIIMEKHLGRYLTKEETVHHINGDKTDNKIENLLLFATSGEHTHFHAINTKNWGAHRELQLV